MRFIRWQALLALVAALTLALTVGGPAQAKKRKCRARDHCGHFVGTTGAGGKFELRVKRKGIVRVVAGFTSTCTNSSSGGQSQQTPLTITRRYGGHPFHLSRKGKVKGTREGRGLDGGDETLKLSGHFKGGSFKGTFSFLSQNPLTSCTSGKLSVKGKRQK